MNRQQRRHPQPNPLSLAGAADLGAPQQVQLSPVHDPLSYQQTGQALGSISDTLMLSMAVTVAADAGTLDDDGIRAALALVTYWRGRLNELVPQPDEDAQAS